MHNTRAALCSWVGLVLLASSCAGPPPDSEAELVVYEEETAARIAVDRDFKEPIETSPAVPDEGVSTVWAEVIFDPSTQEPAEFEWLLFEDFRSIDLEVSGPRELAPGNNRFTLSWRTDRGPGADLRFALQVRPGHDIYLSPLVLRSAPTRSVDDVERLCSRYRGSEAPAEARDLSGLHLLPDSPHPQPVLQHDYDSAGALVVRTATGSSTCTTVPRLPRDTVQQVHLEPQQASDGPEVYFFPLAVTNADGVPNDAGIMAEPLDDGQRSAE